MRKGPSELPKQGEIAKILSKEAERDVSPEKEGKHFVDFSAIIGALEHFGLSTSLFERDYGPDALKDNALVQDARKLIDDLTERILSTDLSTKDEEVLRAVYDYLAEEDESQSADIIFVFGSKKQLRINCAIELYRAGLGERIMISGNRPIYEKEGLSEADTHRGYAIERGVPEEAIIAEEESISIPDNVKSSLNLLDEQGIYYKSITLVNSPFAQRRGWAHMQKFTPPGTKLWRVNSDYSEQFAPENWHKQEKTARVVLNEFAKLKVAVILNSA